MNENFKRYSLRKIRESFLITCPRCRGTLGLVASGKLKCYSCDFLISQEDNEHRASLINFEDKFNKIKKENGVYWKCIKEDYLKSIEAHEAEKMINEKTIKAAKSILAKGDRVELIPVKDGVKVVRVRREEVKHK